jgi:transposase
MNVRCWVELNQTERAELAALVRGGKQAARTLKRAQILLAADAGHSDDNIAVSVGVGGSSVYRTKQRFVLGNLAAALSEQSRPGAVRKLWDKEEALLVATACSKPPQGRAHWTLELLAGELVRLTAHDSLSRETVCRRLAENDLKLWRKDMWCIPQVDGEYVARMEDVLDLYAEPPDPKRPVVASTRVLPSSSARSATRSRPSRVGASATITNTAATAPSISSSSWMSTGLGARSSSPNDARQKTTPSACANSSICIIPMPRASGSCKTTCPPTRPAPSPNIPTR